MVSTNVMESIERESAAETARIFNTAIAASAIAAAFELGLFDELAESTTVSVADFCRRGDLRQQGFESVVGVLSRFGIVEFWPPDKTIRQGPLFAQTHQDKGYFYWLVRGYGNFWNNLGGLLRNSGPNPFIQRHGESIAKAGRDYGAHFVDRQFHEVLHQVPFRVAADFGCGSAARLIQLARTIPGFRGVGIDISHGAVDVARQAAIDAGVADRITVIHCDATRLEPHPEFADVDLLFSFFIGHDLWPRANCLAYLRDIREMFPRATRFLLCDTYRSDLSVTQDVPVFTLGFEVTHAIMGQYIPSVQEWLGVFEESGWYCLDRRDVPLPFTTIFDLRRNRPD